MSSIGTTGEQERRSSAGTAVAPLGREFTTGESMARTIERLGERLGINATIANTTGNVAITSVAIGNSAQIIHY